VWWCEVLFLNARFPKLPIQQQTLFLTEVYNYHDCVLDHFSRWTSLHVSRNAHVTNHLWHTTAVIRGCDPESLCDSLRQAVCLHCLRVVCSESDRSAQCAVVRMFVRSIRTFILFKRVLFVTLLGKALIRLASVDSAEEVRTRSEGLNLVDPLWRVEQWSYPGCFVVSLVTLDRLWVQDQRNASYFGAGRGASIPSTNQGRALPTNGAKTPLYANPTTDSVHQFKISVYLTTPNYM